MGFPINLLDDRIMIWGNVPIDFVMQRVSAAEMERIDALRRERRIAFAGADFGSDSVSVSLLEQLGVLPRI